MPPALINHKYLNMLKINGQQALYLKKPCLLLLNNDKSYKLSDKNTFKLIKRA